jgi:TetR/AcrR family transcriptional regulator of autoinduction and epiphytic fitness
MDRAGPGRGDIDPTLPPEVVLYTIFARACDPVPGFLKAGGQYSDEQIVDWCCAAASTACRPLSQNASSTCVDAR